MAADLTPPVPPGSRGAALVTGGGIRLGAALARHLARTGWDVAIHVGTSRQAGLDLVAELRAAGARAVLLQADLMQPQAAEALVAAAAAALDRPVSLLLASASRFLPDRLESVTAEEIAAHHQVGVVAPLLQARALARQLPAEGPGGQVVLMLDPVMLRASEPRFIAYQLAKAGLEQALRILAQALAPRVRVNALAPGFVLRGVRQSEAHFAAQVASVPLQTSGGPEDVARALHYLLESPAVTGQILRVDGGAAV